MTAVPPLKARARAVADVRKRQIPAPPGTGDNLSLPNGMRRSCACVRSDLHEVTFKFIGKRFGDLPARLIDAGHDGTPYGNVELIDMPGGIKYGSAFPRCIAYCPPYSLLVTQKAARNLHFGERTCRNEPLLRFKRRCHRKVQKLAACLLECGLQDVPCTLVLTYRRHVYARLQILLDLRVHAFHTGILKRLAHGFLCHAAVLRDFGDHLVIEAPCVL